MHTLYILYSDSLDKFYIGESVDSKARLKQHNAGFYQFSYTSQAKDWVMVLELTCLDRVHAKKIERHIKSMKSRKYIKNLIKFHEMQKKLLDRFK